MTDRAEALARIAMNNLAKCLPSIVGAADWRPDPGDVVVPTDNQLFRAVETLRVIDLAYEFDRDAMFALGFLYLLHGENGRHNGAITGIVGTAATRRAHSAWLVAMDAYERGGVASGRLNIVRFLEALTRAAYGNADVALDRVDVPEAIRDYSKHHLGASQPLGRIGLVARHRGNPMDWHGSESPSACELPSDEEIREYNMLWGFWREESEVRINGTR